MKKITVLSLFLTLSSTVMFAQSGLGIKGGPNLTTIRTDAGSFGSNIQESYDTRTGFVFGVWARLGDKFYIQPEALIATKGGSIDVTPTGGGAQQTVKIKYTDLDVPVLIGFKPVNFLRIMAGPIASFKLSEDRKLRDSLEDYTSNPGEAFKDATYGYQVGIGIKVFKIEFDVRRQGSLSDVSALNLQNDSKFSQRAAGWQVTAAFKLL